MQTTVDISDPQSNRVSCQNLCLNPLYINIDITRCVKTNTPILINKRPYKNAFIELYITIIHLAAFNASNGYVHSNTYHV